MELKKAFFAICIVLLASCQKELKTSDIITGLTANPSSVDADGTSTIAVSVNLTDQSDPSKRNIVFVTTAGTWVGGKGDTLVVAANYNNGLIQAKANLTAPSSPVTITITAASQALTINGDHNLTTTVTANNVLPATIHMEPSALGIGTGFSSEVTLTAKIIGVAGQNASKGVKVVFEDFLGTTSAGGHFRQQQLTSDGTSTVSAIYGAPALPAGTPITVKVTVLDAQGNKTIIQDAVTLTIHS